MEQRLYEALVARAPVTEAELVALAAAHGWEERDGPVLHRLRELDLLVRLPADPPRYAAAPPYAALAGVLAGRGRELARAHRHVRTLSTHFYRRAAAAGEDPLIEVVRGPAMQQCLDALNRTLRRELWAFDTPPYLDGSRGGGPPNVASGPDARRNLVFRIVYGREAVPWRLPSLVVTRYATEHIRVGDLPVKLVLYDRQVAVLPLDHVTFPINAMLVIRDPGLVAVLCALFEVYWARAVPLNVRDGQVLVADPPGVAEPPDTDRELLSLLVSGFTDKGIAERLGWTDRTVRGRVRDMMTQLGAATRFQAGYQAVARGWLTDGPDAARGGGDDAHQ